MSLPEVIEAATVAARAGARARARGRHAAARRARRRRAVQALEGSFPLQDIHGNVREARRLLRNTVTIVGGRELERLPLPPRAPWTDEPIWPDVQIPFTEKQRELHEQGRTPDAMAAAAGERASECRSPTRTGRSPTCST